jgi:hypothetical protein
MSDKPEVNKVIESAISDVGYWRWWTDALPKLFQLEFGGVQFYIPPQQPEAVPSTVFSLRFENPTSIAFLDRTGTLPSNWPSLFQQGQIKAPKIEHDRFFISRKSEINQLILEAKNVQIIQGADPRSKDFVPGKIQLAFWAGDLGFAISAEKFVPVDWRGDIALENITKMSEEWWDYWKKYWASKNTTSPFPQDYACEVTIPMNEQAKP